MNFILAQGQRAFALLTRFASKLPVGSTVLARSLLREAQGQLAKRNYAAAAECFRELLNSDRPPIEAHVGLVKALSAQGDWPALAVAARQLMERAPRRPSARRALARALYQTGDIEGARQVLEELIALNARDPVARLDLARIALRRDQPGEALRQVDFASDSNPVNFQQRLLKGEALCRLSRHAEAAALLRAAHELDPRRPEPLRALVDACDRLGRTDDLEYGLQRLHRLQPTEAAVAMRLIRVLLDRDAIDEAEAVVLGVLRRQPENREALTLWADVIGARRRRRDLGDGAGLTGRLQGEALAQARAIGIGDPNSAVADSEVKRLLLRERLAEARLAGLQPHGVPAATGEHDVAAMLRLEALEAARGAGVVGPSGVGSANPAVDRDVTALLRLEVLEEARRAGLAASPASAEQQLQHDIATVLRLEALEEARRAGLRTPADEATDDDVAALLHLEALAEAWRVGVGDADAVDEPSSQQLERDVTTLLRLEALEQARQAGMDLDPRPAGTAERLEDLDIGSRLRLEALEEARRAGLGDPNDAAAALGGWSPEAVSALLRQEAMEDARRAGIVGLDGGPSPSAFSSESDMAALVRMEALAEARRAGLDDEPASELTPAEQLQEDIAAVLRKEALEAAYQTGLLPGSPRIQTDNDVGRDVAALLRLEALEEARRAGLDLPSSGGSPVEQLQQDVAMVLRLEALEEARRAGVLSDAPAGQPEAAGEVGRDDAPPPEEAPAEQPPQQDMATVLRLEALAAARRAGVEIEPSKISPAPEADPAPEEDPRAEPTAPVPAPPLASEADIAAMARAEALTAARRAGILDPDRLLQPGPVEPVREITTADKLEALAKARRSGTGSPLSAAAAAGTAPSTPEASDAPRPVERNAGSPDWIAQRTSDAVYAYRTEALAEVVEIVDAVMEYDRSNATLLEVGGYAANRLGNWPAAARFWGALSAAQISRRGPRLQHATALMESGSTAAALAVVDPLLVADPLSSELIRLKLSILARSKDLEALARFDAELRERSWTKADTAILEAIGSSFLAADYIVAAKRWLELARALDPQNTAALRLQARIAYAERQYGVAASLCQELEQTGTPQQKIEAMLIRARIAHLEGRPGEATLHYERVIADAPGNIEAVTYIVRRNLAARQIARAEEHISAVPRRGNEGTHHWWRALVLQAEGKGDEAAEYLVAALHETPGDMPFRHRVIEFMLETDRLERALEVIEGGLQKEPSSVRLRNRLLQCRIRMECPAEEVVVICSATLAISPRDEDALLQRGNANARLGRRRDAIADFRAGLEAFPRNTTFWRSAVASLLLLGEEVAARTLLDEASAAFAAGSAADLSALADIFDAADLQEEALAFAEAALKLDADSSARQLLARIQVQRGRFDLAWPHLLVLQGNEQRHVRTARLYAQVAAGRAFARSGEADSPDRSFPQAVFDAIVRRSPIVGRTAEDEGRPLRVLHVTSTLGAGGAERQLANTVVQMSKLRDQGVEVELAVEDLNPTHGRDFFLGPIKATDIPVYCLEDERRAANWRDMLAKRPEWRDAVQAISSMPIEVVRNALPLLPILIERRPDVVQLWQDSVCIASGIAAALAGVPRILLCTRSTRPVERQRARRYLEPGFRALLSRPGISMLNNSRNGARDYERWLDLPEGSVGVIYNGYDFATMRGRVDDARSRQYRAELGIPADAPVLGGVMRCSFEKRPELWTETAIELCRTTPGVHALLVGDGPMMEQIKGRVAECGLTGRVHYVGNQSPVEPWMRAMDVMFLSSLTEGLPNVLIEAQSIGVPVATMRIGGAPETVVENETAIVIDEAPVPEIARAIRDLLTDEARRAAYGARAATWATDQFGIEATVNRLFECYAEASRPPVQGRTAQAGE